MLLKILTGLGAAAAAITTRTKYIAQPLYDQIWIALLLLVAYFVGLTLLYVIFLFVLTELTVKLDEPQEKPSKFWLVQYNALAEAVCTVCNLRIHVTGLEKIPTDRRFLLVCNHRSLFDPLVKVTVLKDFDIVYVSKASNFKIPIAGKMMHKTGCLAIDRENNREALKTIQKMTELINNDEASVGIYPEGTRNKEELTLPFHAGSFKAAQKTGAPVVVIALSGTDKAAKNAPFKKTDIYIDVVKVIDGEFAKNNPTHVTAQIAREAIQTKLDEAEKTKETVHA